MKEPTIIPLYLAFGPEGDSRLTDRPVPIEFTYSGGTLHLHLDVTLERCEPAGRALNFRRGLGRCRFAYPPRHPLAIQPNPTHQGPPNDDE